MPAYNEGLALAPVLERLHATLTDMEPRFRTELIVVDDGSRDETAAVVAAFALRFPATRVLTHPVNRGLVAALKSGIDAARGAAVVILDADLSYAPDIVEPLVVALFARRASVVIASPYMRGGRVGNVPFDRLLASRGANWLLSALVGGRIKTFTGMVRAYDTAAIRELLERHIVGEFNAGVLAEIMRERGTIVEIPAALVWPASRTQAPSRMSLRTLWSRFRLVVATARVIRASIRPQP
ncbi:MAG: glycosyltransferase [Vulcanimicrobiaceae bacterium]